MRILAIDWSGARSDAARKIWLAEIRDGGITRLECGRDRQIIVVHLMDEAIADPNFVVGLDFAFSLPSWFLSDRGLPDAPSLWNLVAEQSEVWLCDCEPPFWGRPGKGCPKIAEHFRRTDRDIPAVGGIRPKSVFQIGGAGAVGTGSLRGMPALLELRNAGFAIWPFDESRFPLVVEIYPRALTGGVNKGSPDARCEYLDERYPDLPPRVRADAIGSDDAFDALVSALVMQEHAEELRDLPAIEDPRVRLEGAIWIPEAQRSTSRAQSTTRALRKSATMPSTPSKRVAQPTEPVSTPESTPRVRPFENSYWLPGRGILAGEYPGDRDPVETRRKVRSVLDTGVTVFLDLTHDHELEPYDELLHDEAARRGARAYHIRLPVVDMNVPAPHEMRRILDVVDLAERAGQSVYIHCWGGVGRTGTVIGCLLAENGCDGTEALAKVGELFATTSKAKRARHPEGSPQTSAQRNFVLGWRSPSSRAPSAPRPTASARESSTRSRPAPAATEQRSKKDMGEKALAGKTRRTQAHYRGCLLGVAVGDALGSSVEFMSIAEIRNRFGPSGVRDMERAYGRRGAITDDTQMTLFTAEGLLRASVQKREHGLSSPPDVLHHAYVRWLWTQGSTSVASWEPSKADGWLFGIRELHQRRAHGNTCLSALMRTAEGPAQNNSKGCGGVMRAAPIGMMPFGDAFELATAAAALTHGHPTGSLAGVFAALLDRLFEGDSFDAALDSAIGRHIDFAGEGETTEALKRARRLANEAAPSAKTVERLGGGWVAEEALAIGVYCALVHQTDFAAGVRLAVNYSGDSDSTGGITGAILGAINGVEPIPDQWLRELELRDVITTMADDLFAPDDVDAERYPGW